MKNYLIILVSSCLLVIPGVGVAQTSGTIKMLPPSQSDDHNQICQSGSVNKLLSWDGVRPILCNKDVVVDDAGHVGIGTSAPTQPLTVAKTDGLYGGPASSGQTQPFGAIRLLYGSIAGDMGVHSNGALWLQNSGVTNLASNYPLSFNPNGGNVGVGTLSPASKLDVAGGVKAGNDTSTCSGTNAGTIRWTGSAMEYCNGTAWVGFSAPSLAMSTQQIAGIPFVHDATRTVASGTFATADGYVGAAMACNGAWNGSNPGGNRLSVYLTVGGNIVAAATAQDSTGEMDYWEIDHASLFSYVPKNTAWALVVRANENKDKNGPSNCSLTLTRFGS